MELLEAVLWDLDGTLVDSEPVHGMAFRGAIKELQLELPQPNNIDLLGKTETDVHNVVLGLGGNISRSEWRRLKWKHYLAVSDKIEAVKDVVELIEKLIIEDINMAVVSNSNRNILDLNLSITGLDRYFNTTVSRDDVENGKPSPDGYLAAAKALGTRPENCIVVEDSVPGAIAGRDAGMTTIFAPQLSLPNDELPHDVLYVEPGETLESVFHDLKIFSS